jgi:hypothetical protein
MDTDEDGQGAKGEQTNGQENNIQDLRVATGDSQHNGLSLSPVGHLRNITNRGYGGAGRYTLKCKKSSLSATLFVANSTKPIHKIRPHAGAFDAFDAFDAGFLETIS